MKLAVIGAGAWGTTLTILLAEKGHRVVLWAYEKELVAKMRERRENNKFLPGFPLPLGVEVTNQPAAATEAEICFFVIPTQFLRPIARQFTESLSPSAMIVSASKGIEDKTLKLPINILTEELKKNEKFCALSGPNLSSEIARGLPAAAVAASKEIAVSKFVQTNLNSERFRVYTNADPIGVQLGGALKNVIAIAAGIVDGLALGDNAKAGLLIRGMVEITRLGVALGAKAETFTGLSGMGDLITTCSSRLSRNHFVGESLAKGKKLPEILKEMKEVAEGVPTAAAARALGRQYNVGLPITEEVYRVLHEGKDPYRAIADLTARAATSE